MKNKIFKRTISCVLAFGILSAGGIFSVRTAKTVSAAGKVAITPYIQYTFDSPETMFDNTGSSAADETKDYTLQLLGNATPVNMCYMQDVEFKDNAALYLDGENNPFANGDLTDFTIAMDVTLEYSSWYTSVVSWDGVAGDADNKDVNNGNWGEHRYLRVTGAANNQNSVWARLTDSETAVDANGNAITNAEHYNSFMNINGPHNLYKGDRTVAKTGLVTVIISVDKTNGKLTAKAYEGINEAGSVSIDLPEGWDIYAAADATQKRFTLGGAYDSRNGQHLQMKMKGRMDNVRIYDFALSEGQMNDYASSEEKQLFVEGVEVDQNIVGGHLTVDNVRPEYGETVTITPVPDENAELTEVTVDGVKIQPVNGKYTAVMKEGGIFVSAKFIRSFPVTVSSDVINGTVSADKEVAREGEKVTFTVTPNEGYKLKNVYVNGATVEETDGEYSFVMQSEEIVVSAEFSKWLKISVKDGITGGTVTVNKTDCWENEDVIISVKADNGYEVKKVLANGEEVQKTGIFYKYTVTEDSVVEAVFGKIGASDEKKGCNGSVAGGISCVAIVVAAAVALKKKH